MSISGFLKITHTFIRVLRLYIELERHFNDFRGDRGDCGVYSIMYELYVNNSLIYVLTDLPPVIS